MANPDRRCRRSDGKRKMRFDSLNEAQSAARKGYKAYLCDCGYYHLTHKGTRIPR